MAIRRAGSFPYPFDEPHQRYPAMTSPSHEAGHRIPTSQNLEANSASEMEEASKFPNLRDFDELRQS